MATWYMAIYQNLSGWWYVSTPLKNMKVNWDDELPNIWKKQIHVPNHQSVYIYIDNIQLWNITM